MKCHVLYDFCRSVDPIETRLKKYNVVLLTASLVLLVCFCVFAVVADDITGIIVSDIG
jgi:hypothetical protein